MNAILRIGITLACVLGVSGCAAPPGSPSAYITSMRKKSVAPDRVHNAVTIGKTTKADLLARLGETLSIGFDNGYEVWVYRVGSSREAELVILFAPNGVATKMRVRPPPEPRL